HTTTLIRRVAPRCEAWARIARAYALAGNTIRARVALDEARALFQEVEEEPASPQRALIAICAAAAALSGAEPALLLMEALAGAGNRTAAVAAIAAARAELGDARGALEVARRLNEPGGAAVYSQALWDIMCIQLRRGNCDNMLATMSIYMDPETYSDS